MAFHRDERDLDSRRDGIRATVAIAPVQFRSKRTTRDGREGPGRKPADNDAMTPAVIIELGDCGRVNKCMALTSRSRLCGADIAYDAGSVVSERSCLIPNGISPRTAPLD